MPEDDSLLDRLKQVDFSPYLRPLGVQYVPNGWDASFYDAQAEAGGLIGALRHRLDLDESGLEVAAGANLLDHLHPRIQETSSGLFRDGHFASAIRDAYIAVEARTKALSGLRGINGSKMMGKVFDEQKPILSLNDLSSDLDLDEQIGFKLLFMGAMLGIRNPKAHETIQQRDPNRTLDYLSLASLLMRRLDDAEGRIKAPTPNTRSE
jgi:uncharacterized protein (TIGR02391 family)